MSRVLIVCLNPSLDKTLEVSSFQKQKEHRVLSSSVSTGGKGINVLRTLSVFKRDVFVMGFLSGSPGQWFEEQLHQKGYAMKWLWANGQTRINETIIEKGSRRQWIRFLEQGPLVTPQQERDLKRAFLEEVKKSNVVIFTGSLPVTPNLSLYAQLIAIAKKQNVMTVLDTSSKALWYGLRAAPFLIKPNRQEAESVLGYSLSSKPKRVRALKDFFAFGVRLVLISLGAEGLMGFDGIRAFHIRPKKMGQGLAVGCGDASLAGFVHMFLQGKDFLQCLSFSTACGGANMESVIPGELNKQSIQSALRNIQVEQLI